MSTNKYFGCVVCCVLCVVCCVLCVVCVDLLKIDFQAFENLIRSNFTIQCLIMNNLCILESEV